MPGGAWGGEMVQRGMVHGGMLHLGDGRQGNGAWGVVHEGDGHVGWCMGDGARGFLLLQWRVNFASSLYSSRFIYFCQARLEKQGKCIQQSLQRNHDDVESRSLFTEESVLHHGEYPNNIKMLRTVQLALLYSLGNHQKLRGLNRC